jgi:DNA-binding transcriptional LysR family regulator
VAHPEELADWPLLAGGDDQEWSFTGPGGEEASVEVGNPRMRSGNAGVRVQAAIEGLGVTRVTATFCAEAVARGQLVPLLPAWRCSPLKIYALLPGKMVPAKVRVFLDLLELEAQGSL